MNINDFEMMTPMKYYDNPEPEAASAIQKRQDMIDNKNHNYVATEKHDGDWGLFIHYTRGNNLIRSRAISKVTGKYGDMTAKLPHLATEMDTWPDNTVVVAEICWNEYGTNANTVGTILRCLPAKAVERQKEKKLCGYIFDMLMLNGNDMSKIEYINRLNIAAAFVRDGNFTHFHMTQIFTNDFAEAADEIIAAGGEGCVIQLKDNPYMPGTRTAWKTLKLKQCLPHMDLKVIATLNPNRDYEGDCPESWPYWYQDMPNANSQMGDFPVTKPYFMGWKNGITVLLPSGIATDVASGLTDDDRAYLATNEAQEKIAAGELWAEVKAMSVNDRGALRHPALVRLRTDLNSKGE